MSDWVQEGLPVFAVVGRVNMGKSAVLATLLEIDDDDLIRVSPTPGETTRCQLHRVVFGGKECIRFIDTPGFSRPIEAMREIQRIHGHGTPGLESIRRFTELPGHDFEDEKRLLAPLVEGAGVLYVVDPSKPLRDDFLAEMEILRWTGRPRLALLNRRQHTSGTDQEAWKSRLGGAFNLTRGFDAHHARYDERLRLLKALLEIEEQHREALIETIRRVEEEWQTRREQAAEALIGFLESALALRVQSPLESRDLAIRTRRKRHAEMLTTRYFEKLADLERQCAAALLKIHRHHLLKADADPASYPDHAIDLESAETWSKWGLGRTQLALAAAVAGGAAGLAIDVATGGLSHGLGAVAGAIGGGSTAWFKGGSLPDLRITLAGGLKLASGETRTLTIGPPRNPNFPWILLDGMLVRYRQILARAHGRRDEQRLGSGIDPADVPTDAAVPGLSRTFPQARRDLLAKWFGSCLKGAPNRSLEPEVFEAMVVTLADAAKPEAPTG